MGRKKLILVLFVSLLIFVLPQVLNSQSKRMYPDLEVTKMWLGDNCQINITIKNNGPGKLKAPAYDLHNGVAVQMYKKNKPWGGIRLGAIDKNKVLVNPGGTITHVWFPLAANLKLPPGGTILKVIVDNNNVVMESNELNNSLTKKVNCVIMANISQVFGDSCMGYGTPTSRCFSVYGSNFGNTVGSTVVYINTSIVQSGMWEDSSFLAVVPDGVLNLGVSNLVYLKRNGLLVSNKKSFIPYGSVDSVSPDSLEKMSSIRRANKKKFVKVRLTWFFSQGNNKIFFGNTEMPIISWTQLTWPAEAEVVVRIPVGLPLGLHVVRVKNGNVVVTNPNSNTPIFDYK